MRHATAADLDRLEELLSRLRAIPQLRERRPGSFSRGARAFLHFHAEGADVYADVKVGGSFTRMRVSSPAEQAAFLARVGNELAGHP
jgi:hypothetical protein